MRRAYQKPVLKRAKVQMGEFCASTCATKPNDKDTWADIVADINSAGYRTLEAGDATAPNMVS